MVARCKVIISRMTLLACIFYRPIMLNETVGTLFGCVEVIKFHEQQCEGNERSVKPKLCRSCKNVNSRHLRTIIVLVVQFANIFFFEFIF